MVNKNILNTVLALIVSTGSIAACTQQTPNASALFSGGNETVKTSAPVNPVDNQNPNQAQGFNNASNNNNTDNKTDNNPNNNSATEPGLITPEEYYRYKANNQIISINTEDQASAAKAEKAKEAADQATVEEFVKNNPDRAGLLTDPSPNDPAIKPTEDGNYLLKIKNSEGIEEEVVTLGKTFRNQVIASALQRFPAMDNQLIIYKELFENLPVNEQADGALNTKAQQFATVNNPNGQPTDYQKTPADSTSTLSPNRPSTQPEKFPRPEQLAKMPVDQITKYNEILIQRLYDRLPLRPIDPNIPYGYVSNPDSEQGAGPDSTVFGDRTGYSASCGTHKAGGLYQNFNWPGKYFATSVKNQGNRGTCVAFAISSAHEMKIAQTYSRWTNLSEQDAYFKNKAVWWPSNYGDGLDTNASWSKMDAVNYHPPFENEWLYNPSYSRIDTGHSYSNSCVSYPQNCSDTNHQGRYFSVYLPLIGHVSGYLSMGAGTDSYNVTGSVAELWNHSNIDLSMLCTFINLYLGRPVVMSAAVTPSFDGVDANGFVHYAGASESNRGGHALHVTGYIDNSQISARMPGAPLGAGGGYFIIKNSWGVCNGDAGYYYIPYQWIRNYTYSMLAFY